MKFNSRVLLRPSFKFTRFTLFAVLFFLNMTAFSIGRIIAPGQPQSSVAEASIPDDLPSSGDKNLDGIIYRAGEAHGIDPRLLHAVIWQESKYDVRARSHKGAQGLMQMIPATARRFECKNAMDPQENVVAGTKYLRWLLERFDGNVRLALAAYNAGEGSVDKYDGVPPFGETQKYVRIIISRYGKTFHPIAPLDQASSSPLRLRTTELAQLR